MDGFAVLILCGSRTIQELNENPLAPTNKSSSFGGRAKKYGERQPLSQGGSPALVYCNDK